MNRVLIVDDERWVRAALRWTVDKTGLPFTVVHECADGLEALDWLKTNQVELILSDIRMPVMDGLAFVRELRQRQSRQDVILITVHDDFQFVQNAIRQGVCDYLLKPVELPAMKECLENWLQRRRREAAVAACPDEQALSPIQQVLRYLAETPLGNINLTDAARRIHMNPSYLSQLFKQEMQVCFVDYVTDLRMKEAKRLLATTTLRISEIADRLGYADLAYFSNIFKKHTGYSPSEYRKQQVKPERAK
ncbi:response regulator transcription factor [Sporolituus thermophilus]|uniref:Two component transcriptional regulator, AraC family n=1 Tax=Sporolituus thermophilus DSM 23256 TaxID=1123285 RepID=A0A1G7P8K4_9FIRM|nr:response regulator [Sporolituus thermophilus]SDF82554.1 two component transcriptional regulator, AraC family [Sporolituus thermophilus DSM 23256]